MDYGLNDYPLTTAVMKAGKWYRLDVPGNYVQIIKASGDINIRLDNGASVIRHAGMGWPANDFKIVEVMSPIDQPATVIIALGFTTAGVPYDSKVDFTGTTVNVNSRASNTVTPAADVLIANAASVVLLVNDATRLGVWVSVPLVDSAGALITGNVGVRLGDSTIAAGKGVQLLPGDKVYWPSTAALYCYNETATPINMSITADRFV